MWGAQGFRLRRSKPRVLFALAVIGLIWLIQSKWVERSTPKYFYMVDASSGVSCKLYVVLIRLPLQKRAHWKTSPVKSGVPIRLWEQKRGFKDYRRFWSLMNFIAVNYSHTFKRQCRNNRVGCHCFKCWNVFVSASSLCKEKHFSSSCTNIKPSRIR